MRRYAFVLALALAIGAAGWLAYSGAAARIKAAAAAGPTAATVRGHAFFKERPDAEELAEALQLLEHPGTSRDLFLCDNGAVFWEGSRFYAHASGRRVKLTAEAARRAGGAARAARDALDAQLRWEDFERRRAKPVGTGT